MNVINVLEKIGQTASKKQYKSSEDMLNSLEISHELIKTIQEKSLEFVCGILPEDDDDENIA